VAKYTRNDLTGLLSAVNVELEKIENSLADKLDREPSVAQANSMGNLLDMNSQRITNLAAPSNLNDAARLRDVQSASTEAILPPQEGQGGKYLTTDGSGTFWEDVDTTIQYVDTFSNLQALEPEDTNDSFICLERANAHYVLQASGYAALSGDVTFANGRVGALQFTKTAIAEKFGVTYSGDETVLLQSIIDRVANTGGEIVLSALVNVSGITIPQRVVLKGVDYGFANQFIDNEVSPKGSGLFLITGSDSDVVTLKLAVTLSDGDLVDDYDGTINNDYRYFGGLKDLVVYGNRSDTANPPSVVDNNTSGNGVAVKGVRYPILHNVVIMMCAEDGFTCDSFDYGLGSNACNNHDFDNVICLSNAVNGASLSGGDAIMRKIIAGYNGNNGITSTSGSGSITGECWNNQNHGIQISGGKRITYDFASYDNKVNGWRITDTKGVTCRGSANANGRDTGQGAGQRVGVLTGDSNEGLVLNINSDGSDGVTTYQAYGFNISNASNPIVVAGCFATNNFSSDWLITTPANIIKDTNAP
tara:strand:- start:28129 stop:29724 length:1596 start_codon:yes stop_codon:yes gene_type:complete